jgi:hypothetical protein
MKSVCEEILLSSGLRKMIALTLHLGNMLNASSGKDAVTALRMSCLLKLSQTRSFDGKTSFMDYTASVAWKNCSSIDFPRGLRVAIKIEWQQTVTEFERLDATLPHIREMALKDRLTFIETDEELNVLGTTGLGRFVLEAYRKAAMVYAEIQDVHTACHGLCDYFGESSADPQNLIRDVAAFCDQFQASIDKAKLDTSPHMLETIPESTSSCGSI